MKRTITTVVLVLAVLMCSTGGAAEEDDHRRARPDFPLVRDGDTTYHVLRGDFHFHTPHSDGHISPRERMLEAWREGYDVVAITDHRNFKAYEEALPVARSLDLLLVRGMETGIKDREHLLALGFSADYEPRNPHEWAMEGGADRVHFKDQLERLANAGGFVVYAHPHADFEEPYTWGVDQGILQGIEVKNAGVDGDWGSVEDRGTDWYPFALDRAMDDDLTVFANSDAHHERARKEFVYTLVFAEKYSVPSVMEALRARRTLAWFNGMLCGPEELQLLLVENVVDMGYRSAGGQDTWLWMKNRSPLPLKAQVEAGEQVNDTVSIEPGQQVLLPCSQADSEVTVTWKNLWIRSDENLVTSHRLD